MSTEPSLGSACHQPPNAPGQLTVTQKETRETQIVVEGGPKPGTAGFVGHILWAFCDEDATPRDSFGQAAFFVEAIRSRTASPLFPGGKEACIFHSERVENTPLEHFSERGTSILAIRNPRRSVEQP